jgi:serine/threonine protein kinase
VTAGADDDAPRPGTRLLGGRYRLEEVIGTGGMAIVWCGTDERLGRRVAIKLIADTLAADPAYLERFTREARTAAGLSHRNLVPVYDYAAGAERPFLVMELVEGGTLADRIAREPVQADEACAVARDLLSALECVHQAGILHRDIKPANVLLGGDGRARLTDFGIAHPEDATRLTQTGNVIGTIRYLAPELIQGEPPSVRSDLYALGILIRELAGDALDGELRALVDRLTAPEPAQRPASAGEALAMIAEPPAAAAAPEPTETKPQPAAAAAVSTRPPAQRRDPRSAAIPVIAAAIVVLLVVAFVLSLGGGDDEGRAGDPTPGSGAAAGQPPITLEGRLDQLDRIIRGEAP